MTDDNNAELIVALQKAKEIIDDGAAYTDRWSMRRFGVDETLSLAVEKATGKPDDRR